MFSESESELRDIVVQNLESCGFLNKIKAELRAGVFNALSEDGSLKKKIPLINKKLDDFMNTSDGKLALSVVREFLKHFNLNFTLSVFDPEVSSSNPYLNRKDLCEDLNINDTEFDGPILLALLRNQGTKLSNVSAELTKNLDINFINEKSKEKNSGNNFIKNTEDDDFFDVKSGTNQSEAVSSFPVNRTANSRNFFSKPEEKDIFKDQSIDHFFDDPVPSEKPQFLHLSSTSALIEQTAPSSTFLTLEKQSDQKKTSLFTPSDKLNTITMNDHKKLSLSSEKQETIELSDHKKLSSTFLSSEKGSLSSLRDLPSLNRQDNSKNNEQRSLPIGSDNIGGASSNTDDLKDVTKKDTDPESNEEYSDRQMNSEESIEEEIEDEFSAGLDDLLNSSLSLGDDATSDQTVSQTSVVDGVDHIESCNTIN